MSGMQRKKQRRDHEKRLTEHGLPRDANDWTADDWRDLYLATEWVKRRVAARHKQERESQ